MNPTGYFNILFEFYAIITFNGVFFSRKHDRVVTKEIDCQEDYRHHRNHCYKSTLIVGPKGDHTRQAVYKCEVLMHKDDGTVENRLVADYQLRRNNISKWTYE